MPDDLGFLHALALICLGLIVLLTMPAWLPALLLYMIGERTEALFFDDEDGSSDDR